MQYYNYVSSMSSGLKRCTLNSKITLRIGYNRVKIIFRKRRLKSPFGKKKFLYVETFFIESVNYNILYKNKDNVKVALLRYIKKNVQFIQCLDVVLRKNNNVITRHINQVYTFRLGRMRKLPRNHF